MKKFKLYDYLDEKTKDFFPSTGEWEVEFFKEQDELCKNRFPFNTSNDGWLTNMIYMHIIKERDSHNINITYADVSNYVNESEEFNKRKHDYQLEIVKWTLKATFDEDSEWIEPIQYASCGIYFSPCFHIEFRRQFIDMLGDIGIEKEVVEEGLDKNLDLWLEESLNKSFYNNYSPLTAAMLFEGKGRFSEPEEDHRKLWIKLRTYEYCKEHSIDFPGGNISKREVKELREKVKQKNLIRNNALPFGIRSSRGFNRDDGTY